MNWRDRLDHYHAATGFPRGISVTDDTYECLWLGEDDRAAGMWIMGNDYTVKSRYYGGYPAGYLRRIKALFPDKKRVLHVFSGRVDLSAFPGDTVDCNPALNPTYLDDAQELTRVPLGDYDLVLADPPYSVEDCEHYGTSMVSRNKVMRALSGLPGGAHVVWLDQVLPMYRKDTWAIDGLFGMVKSTNHRFRVVSIFRRLEAA